LDLIKKDFYKLYIYIRKHLENVIENRKVLNISELKDFDNEDIQTVLLLIAIQTVLLLIAIDTQNFEDLKRLINDSKNIQYIDYEFYRRNLLSLRRLNFIIDNEIKNFRVSSKLIKALMKLNAIHYLDVIFRKIKIYDNNFIIYFCNLSKNKIPMSISALDKYISNENI